MIKIIKKITTNRVFVDLLGLFPPLFMFVASFVPIFFTKSAEQVIQVFLVAYFLTVFLIRFILIILRNRANRNESPLKGHIQKAKMMIITSVLSLIESIAIVLAFYFIIFTQKDKGFFASNIYTALIYSGFFIVRLIFNLVKMFGGIYTKDSYDKTIIYMETITLLYMMVVSFNYLLSASKINAIILESIVAGLAILSIIFVCIIMFLEGVISRHKYRKLLKEEIKTLKKNKRIYSKEVKAKRKIEKITGVEVIDEDDVEYIEDERDV